MNLVTMAGGFGLHFAGDIGRSSASELFREVRGKEASRRNRSAFFSDGTPTSA